MNWFQRHLNWTVLLAGIGGHVLAYFITASTLWVRSDILELDVGLDYVYLIRILVVLPIALWVVKRKGRSFWWLCLLLIPFGWIGVLFLRNQRELSGSVIRRDPKNLFLYVLASSLAVAFLIAMGVGFFPFWDDYKTANDELSLTPKVNFEEEKEGPRRQFPQQKDEPAKKEYDYPSVPLIK